MSLSSICVKGEVVRRAALGAVAFGVLAFAQISGAETNQTVYVRAAGFTLRTGGGMEGSRIPMLALDSKEIMEIPFTQSAIKQDASVALLGPNPKIPYFTVRFAMPIPPEN